MEGIRAHPLGFIFAVIILVSTAGTPVIGCNCNIFILAGQSNMFGQGGIIPGPVNKTTIWDGYTPPECKADPRISRLNNDSVWEEAHEPLHEGISSSECNVGSGPGGVGPGMPFSNSFLARDPLTVIGLVPCAVGGTSISQWSSGSCLYNRMLRRVRAAELQGGVLRGMLWYQGEADAVKLADAQMYGSRLEAFFTDLRQDLLCPSLPIIQVALASGGSRSNREIVRQTQLTFSHPNVKCVDAAGLPLNPDDLHLTTDSQVRLGTMMADVFLTYFN